MKNLLRTWSALLLAVALAFASVAYAQEPGVYDNEIRVGESAVFSGDSAVLGTEMKQGILAYFEEVNRSGGINGRRLRLIDRDDKYEPALAKANTEALINQDHVFALLGYVGTPTTNAALPVIKAAKIPLIGPFTGAASLRDPENNRYVFNLRASYMDEGEPIVKVLTAFDNKVAIFRQDDAYGEGVQASVEAALKRRDLTPLVVVKVPRNSTNLVRDVGLAADQIKQSGATSVALGSVYSACAELVKQLALRGVHPMFASVSFIGTSALIDKVGAAAEGIGIDQVMPSPFSDSLPISRAYRAAMRAAGYNSFNFGSIEGYMAAKLLGMALRHAGAQPTREKLMAALESLSSTDMGGFEINFSPTNHNGGHFTELWVVSKNATLLR